MTRTELLKTAKPILFNTEMVMAILDGRKTVTRRVALPNKDLREFRSEKYPNGWWIRGRVCKDWDTLLTVMKRDKCKCRYRKGDILYVRETWCWCPCWDCGQDTPEGCIDPSARRTFSHNKGEYGCIGYKASFAENEQPPGLETWHPSIHMPKEAARIFLRVTDVRVERVQDITEEQAKAEGANQCYEQIDSSENRLVTYLAEDSNGYYISGFKCVWDSTIKKSDLDRYGWAANPWVWLIEFERVGVHNDK